MAKRYYLCPVIGTGASTDDPVRPAVADLGASYVAVIPSDPNTGQPVYPWCLVMVAQTDHTPLLTPAARAAGIDALPDFGKDIKVNAMHDATRSAMWQTLLKRAVPFNDLGSVTGYREVIRRVGQTLDPNFHEDAFDLADR